MRKPEMFSLCNHGSCTNIMLVCSFATHLASTAETLLQCCRFICIKLIETGAIVTTSWSLVRTKLLLSDLGGLRHSNYPLFTGFLLHFYRLLVCITSSPFSWLQCTQCAFLRPQNGLHGYSRASRALRSIASIII